MTLPKFLPGPQALHIAVQICLKLCVAQKIKIIALNFEQNIMDLQQRLREAIAQQLRSYKVKKIDLVEAYNSYKKVHISSNKAEFARLISTAIVADLASSYKALENPQFLDFQLRKEIIGKIEEKLALINLGRLSISKKIQDIFKFDSNPPQPLNNSMSSNRLIKIPQENIENIWTSNTKIIQCLCPKAPSNLEQSKKVATCYRCHEEYHTECFWAPEKGEDIYQCPFCYLRYSVPQKQVKEILFGGYLPYLKKQKIQYRIGFALDPRIKLDKTLYIQARCVKFNSKNRYQISWPDNCSFSIGKIKVNSFTPLQTSSPLKRRADQPIKLDKNRLQVDNEIIIEERYTSENGFKLNRKSNHLIAIMVVTDLSNEGVVSKFEKNQLKVNESKQILTRSMSQQKGDILIQKIAISLKCQYFGSKMKLPARSRLCNTHIQPFDLMNFINSSIQAKTSTRKWKCPICDKRAYDLVIDKYILNLMKDHPNVNEIVFRENGEPEMIQGKEDSDHDSEAERDKERQVEKKEKIKQNVFINIDLSQDEEEKQEQLAIEESLQPKNFPPVVQVSNNKPNAESFVIELEQEEDNLIPIIIHKQSKQKTQKSKFPQNNENSSALNYVRITDSTDNLEIKKIRKLNDGTLQIAIPKKREKFLAGSVFVQLSSDQEVEKIQKKAGKNIQLQMQGQQKEKEKDLSGTQKKAKPVEIENKEFRQKTYKIKQAIPKAPQAAVMSIKNKPRDQKPVQIPQKQKPQQKPICVTKESRQLIISIDSDDEGSPKERTNEEIGNEMIDGIVVLKKSLDKQGKIEINEEDTEVFEDMFGKLITTLDGEDDDQP